MNKQIVAIGKGDEYQSTMAALELIKDQIRTKLEVKKPKEIFLKPNWLKYRPDWLPITKLDTLRAAIDFFNKLGNFNFVIGDGVSMVWGWTSKEFLSQTNYYDLEKEYPNVKVIDLNDYPAQEKFTAKTIDGDKPVRYYEPILKAQFLVSIAKIKTHNLFANTLSLKNVAIGCAHWQDKVLFHARYNPYDTRQEKPNKKSWYKRILPMANFNFYQGSQVVYPDVAIIDGVGAMEENGPGNGTLVNLGVTLASADALSADIVATRIMGFKLAEIPYLDILNDVRKPAIRIIGENIGQFKYRFKTDKEYKKYRCCTKKEDVLRLITPT